MNNDILLDMAQNYTGIGILFYVFMIMGYPNTIFIIGFGTAGLMCFLYVLNIFSIIKREVEK